VGGDAGEYMRRKWGGGARGRGGRRGGAKKFSSRTMRQW
jgi:hypothetical protein